MIKRRPRPTVRSKAHRKINKYYDRKNSSEDKLIRLMEKAMIPSVLKHGPRSARGYRRGGGVQVFMSDEVKMQCGKKLARDGEENKKHYNQREIIEAALSELMEDSK